MTDFLGDMEQSSVADAARSKLILTSQRPADWFAWRRKHKDLGIGKAGEDGSLDEWQSLLRELGADALTTAVIKARGSKRDGARIWFADVLQALEANNPDDSTHHKGQDQKAAKRARIDLLIWCLCHSPTCYADAIKPWLDAPGDTVSKRTHIGMIRRIPKTDPLTPAERERYMRLAENARKELVEQVGCPDEQRYKPYLYQTVRSTPELVAWLRIQRLIP